MFVILVTISIIVVTNALYPITTPVFGDKKAKEVINKYIAIIPDIEEQYVVDERLSRAISHYFNGKISSFPLYKVSVKIDRNPVEIPWTLGEPNDKEIKIYRSSNKQVKKRYKYEEIVKQNTSATAEKLLSRVEEPLSEVEKPLPTVEKLLSTAEKPSSTAGKPLSTIGKTSKFEKEDGTTPDLLEKPTR